MKKNKKKSIFILTIICFIILGNTIAFATNIQDSVIFTGTQKLIKDATTALMILAPIIGALLIGFSSMKKGAADDMEQKTWQKRINTAIYSVMGVELASVIINLFMGYFKQ